MPSDWDLIIRNASIYDGTGAKPFPGSLAIKGDRIAIVGAVSGAGAVVIDAHNRAVAPGFIDVHSHDDFAVFLTPEMDFKVMQGVTTDVVGNCGMGVAPYQAAGLFFGLLYPDVTLPRWEGYAGYLHALDRD